MAENQPHTILFTNFGKVGAKTLEEARVTHNATAGQPDGVAAAKALGDLSHLVFAPLSGWTGDLIFLDQWTSAEGLQQFFADPQVQAGASQLFTEYEPVVWRPESGFNSYHISEPIGRADRIVGILRGPVASMEKAQSIMNGVWSSRVNQARKLGLVSHETFVRLAAPGTPEASEIIAIDMWSHADGFNTLYEDASFMQGFDGVFTGEASTWILQRPAGSWIEW